MFKMIFHTQVKPEYPLSTPKIKVKPLGNPRPFRDIFSPLVSNTPCSSCGQSK